MNDADNKEYKVCPCCGEKMSGGKFCTSCGAPLSVVTAAKNAEKKEQEAGKKPGLGMGVTPWFQILNPQGGENDAKSGSAGENPQESEPVSDAGLTLLGEYFKETVATIGGDGYDEIVLYQKEADGSFQIHTYTKYVSMQKEIHHSFRAKEGAYEALLALAEQLHLQDFEGKRGFGLCGGRYVCKFRKDGVLHAVTTDNLCNEGPGMIIQVGGLLGSYKEEEIFQER